jgi:hypothetical protein
MVINEVSPSTISIILDSAQAGFLYRFLQSALNDPLNARTAHVLMNGDHRGFSLREVEASMIQVATTLGRIAFDPQSTTGTGCNCETCIKIAKGKVN